MIRRFFQTLFFIASIFFVVSCNSNFAQLQKRGTINEKYLAAVRYFENEDYNKAMILFDELTPLMRGDSTAESIQIKNAYSNYYLKQYSMSAYLFKNFYATYANSPLAEEASYMAANSLFKDSPEFNLDQTSSQTAIDALQSFINTYPYSEFVGKCTQDLKDLRFRLETKAYKNAMLYYKTREASINGLNNYKATVVTIENFKKEFPDSYYLEELSYIQALVQVEYADVSIFKKQKERYLEGVDLYEKFIEKFPNSEYRNKLIKYYDIAQKGLDKVAKTELEIEKLKEKDTKTLELKN